MALKLNERYPGRFNNPTTDYPQGSFKNRSAPGAKDGSYLEKDWANDKEGFFQALLTGASITPNGNVDTAQSSQYYAAFQQLNFRRLTTGQALPTQNIGPIWHDDFASIMTWQTFNANGANYIGYASVLVGSLLADTQSTPRMGYIASGSISLNRITYAALRNWAIHNGLSVAVGAWVAGSIIIADNADGTTFRVYDVRAEFPRFWDAGRGVDVGRTFGSSQTDAIKGGSFTSSNVGETTSGTTGVFSTAALVTAQIQQGTGAAYARYTVTLGAGTETRSRNTALLAAIKF